VVADRGLAEPERFGEMADARLAAGLRLDQAQEPQARRIGDRLQRPRELGRVFLGERLLEERRAYGLASCR